MSIKDILNYNNQLSTPLFQGDIPTHPTKSKLMDELETKFNMNIWNRNTKLQTHTVVDFMSKLRQMSLNEYETIVDVINATINSATHFSQHTVCVHLIFDSYIEQSLKQGECNRRKGETLGLEMIGMTKDKSIHTA